MFSRRGESAMSADERLVGQGRQRIQDAVRLDTVAETLIALSAIDLGTERMRAQVIEQPLLDVAAGQQIRRDGEAGWWDRVLVIARAAGEVVCLVLGDPLCGAILFWCFHSFTEWLLKAGCVRKRSG